MVSTSFALKSDAGFCFSCGPLPFAGDLALNRKKAGSPPSKTNRPAFKKAGILFCKTVVKPTFVVAFLVSCDTRIVKNLHLVNTDLLQKTLFGVVHKKICRFCAQLEWGRRWGAGQWKMGGCLEVESKHPAGTQLYRLGFVWCAAAPIHPRVPGAGCGTSALLRRGGGGKGCPPGAAGPGFPALWG